jgi:hypothetical protein
MIVMKISLFVVITGYYFLFSISSLAACNNMEGLYEKRIELLEKYTRDIGNDYLKNKDKADIYIKQREAIDQNYRTTIHNIFFDHEKKEYTLLKKCCDNTIKDKYIFYVCKLITYYRDRNINSLLNDIPVDKEGLVDLWNIDTIIFSDKDYYNKPHPQLFDKASFVVLFLDSIYQLATKGNIKAIDRFLTISSFADGEYGEYAAEKILDLFEKYPNVIIKNWVVVRKHKPTINFETTDYDKKATAIIQKYKYLCNSAQTDSSICKEIIDFLKQKRTKNDKR